MIDPYPQGLGIVRRVLPEASSATVPVCATASIMGVQQLVSNHWFCCLGTMEFEPQSEWH